MKFVVNIVLLMFVSFLSLPTIISVVKNDSDISVVYTLTEEEMNKEKEVVVYTKTEFQFTFIESAINSTLIQSQHLQKKDNFFGDVFLPPPEVNIS